VWPHDVVITEIQAHNNKETSNNKVFCVRGVYHFSSPIPTLTQGIHYLAQGPRPTVKPVSFLCNELSPSPPTLAHPPYIGNITIHS